MNKKEYMEPQVEVMKIQTAGMLSSSGTVLESNVELNLGGGGNLPARTPELFQGEEWDRLLGE
jgi:hypothetical protein